MNFSRYFLVVLIVGLVLNTSVQAATYYTTGSGNWDSTDAIWGTDTNGPGSTWGSLSIVAGDVIVIDDDITLDNFTVEITVDVTIIIDAELGIEKTLQLTAGSTIEVTSNGTIIATGGGSGPKIKFGTGTAQWDGSDLDLSGPGTLDVTSTGSLPVDLIFFNALTVDKQVYLSWATASEENFDYFEIQRAVGSDEFESIGALSGAGENVFSIQEYEFYDEYPLDGINYYRLKTIDLDGTFEYSDIQAVKMVVSGEVLVYPNPIRNQQLQLMSTYSNTQQYRFYDTRGALIFSGEFSTGSQSVRLPDLQPGLYILKVSGIGVAQTLKVLVE